MGIFSFCNLFYIRTLINFSLIWVTGNQNHHHQHEASHIIMVLQTPWIFKRHAMHMRTLLPCAYAAGSASTDYSKIAS